MGYVHHIDPVMVSIAGLNVYWYGFAYTFGFAFMVWWLWRKRHELGWSPAQAVNLSIISVVSIPTSWTTGYIALKRGAVMEQTAP